MILKVGKTSKGSALAASHTGSLAGSDKAFDAIVKKFGVIRGYGLHNYESARTGKDAVCPETL